MVRHINQIQNSEEQAIMSKRKTIMQQLYHYFLKAMKTFWQQAKGVYSIIMGLITIFILIIIGFTIDGSGVLLDRARLADSLDQAALAITAENNQYRDEMVLGTSDRDGVKRDQKAIETRDKTLIRSYVEHYINDYSDVKSVDYKCNKDNGVECSANATILRDSLLPLSFNQEVFIPEQMAIAGVAKAYKQKTTEKVNPPTEIMFVVNYSRDLYSPIQKINDWTCYKMDNLTIDKYLERYDKRCRDKYGNMWRDVMENTVNGYAKALNFFSVNGKDVDEAYKNDRLGLTAYAFGAQPINESVENCVVPFDFLDSDIPHDPVVEYQTYQKHWLGNYTAYEVGSLSSYDKKVYKFFEEDLLSGVDFELHSTWLVKGIIWSNVTNVSSSFASTILSKYVPLYLGIAPLDIRDKKKWYDIPHSYQHLKIDVNELYLNNAEGQASGVVRTVDQIVDPWYRTNYITYRNALMDGDEEQIKKARANLFPNFDVDGYGVGAGKDTKQIGQHWILYQKRYRSSDSSKSSYSAGHCLNYSKRAPERDSRWFTPKEVSEWGRLVNPDRAGGGKSTIAGFLMGAYNMVNDVNPETTPDKLGVNTRRAMVFMDIDSQYGEDISTNSINEIEPKNWALSTPRDAWFFHGTNVDKDASGNKPDANWVRSTSRYYCKNHQPPVRNCDYVEFHEKGTGALYRLIPERFLQYGYNERYEDQRPLMCDAIRARLMTPPFQKDRVKGKELEVYDPKIIYVKYHFGGYFGMSTVDRYWQRCADEAFFIGLNKNGQPYNKDEAAKVERLNKVLKELREIKETTGFGDQENEEVGHNRQTTNRNKQ